MIKQGTKVLEKFNVEDLLTQYKPLVNSISRRYYLVGADLDDIVQEGMIGLYKAINSYDESKNVNFLNFAKLCITRQIQSAIKKNNRLKNEFFKDLINEDDVVLNNMLCDELNPEDKIISMENCFYIKNEIKQKLSKFEKLILREYLLGKTYEDIAKKLEITKKSVDNGLNRIRNKLSYLLKY